MKKKHFAARTEWVKELWERKRLFVFSWRGAAYFCNSPGHPARPLLNDAVCQLCSLFFLLLLRRAAGPFCPRRLFRRATLNSGTVLPLLLCLLTFKDPKCQMYPLPPRPSDLTNSRYDSWLLFFTSYIN